MLFHFFFSHPHHIYKAKLQMFSSCRRFTNFLILNYITRFWSVMENTRCKNIILFSIFLFSRNIWICDLCDDICIDFRIFAWCKCIRSFAFCHSVCCICNMKNVKLLAWEIAFENSLHTVMIPMCWEVEICGVQNKPHCFQQVALMRFFTNNIQKYKLYNVHD